MTRSYAIVYVLTPKGIDAKIRLTHRFLRRKLAEYEMLRSEIEALRAEEGLNQPETGMDPRPLEAKSE